MTEPGTETRIDELSKRVDFGFEQTNQRLGRVEDDLREMRAETTARFDKVDARFDKIDARFDKIDARFEKVDRRFGRFDDKMQAGFERVDGEFLAVRREMKEGFDMVGARFDSLYRTIIYLLGGSLSVATAGILAAAFHAFS